MRARDSNWDCRRATCWSVDCDDTEPEDPSERRLKKKSTREIEDEDDEGEENEKARVSSFSWFYFWCNVGNFGGESINPELRATAGPVYAMMSITGSLFIGFASFVACKRFYIQKPLDRSESAKEDPDATRLAQLPWRRRAQLWWLSDNGRAVWKLIKVFALLIPFWAVLNQQNSSWDDQGSNMNGQLCFTASKCVTIAPDTM